MFRSHRVRLTLAAAGSAGLLFLILFTLSDIGLQRAEIESASEELAPAVNQVLQDIRSNSGKPDLAEVVASNPQIGLAVYNSTGSVLAKDGWLIPPFSNGSGLSQVGGIPVILKSESEGGLTVVAALNWSSHADLVHRFALLCVAIWFPLVGMVALATWMTARATFLPLERLAREAEDMSAESLSSRLNADEAQDYIDFVRRLNRMLDRIEASVRREERFLSDAAHELRTPLTAVRGQIETVLMKRRTEDDYRKTLAVLGEETSRLASLVELILRSAVKPDAVDDGISLEESMEKAHARWVDRYSAKEAVLQLEVLPVRVSLLETEFDVIVDNLLSNSLRVSSAGNTCTIGARIVEGKAVFHVSDEGPGIPEMDQERVFDRLTRGNTEGGFGIGLALCKRIVERRGGRIWVEPREPHGCVFSVEIPQGPNPSP